MLIKFNYLFRAKEGEPIESSERVKLDFVAKEAEVSSTLVIEPATLSDTGTYVATARNECGEAKTTGNIVIQSESLLILAFGKAIINFQKTKNFISYCFYSAKFCSEKRNAKNFEKTRKC